MKHTTNTFCRTASCTNNVSQPRSDASKKTSGCAALTRETAVVIIIVVKATISELILFTKHPVQHCIQSACTRTEPTKHTRTTATKSLSDQASPRTCFLASFKASFLVPNRSIHCRNSTKFWIVNGATRQKRVSS